MIKSLTHKMDANKTINTIYVGMLIIGAIVGFFLWINQTNAAQNTKMSLLEQNQINMTDNMRDIQTAQDKANEAQVRANAVLLNMVDSKFTRIEDKIERLSSGTRRTKYDEQ